MLLAKTFKSSTFKLALISIAIFGAVLLALFAYVYWSVSSYVRSQSDRAIAAEQVTLKRAYNDQGRNGLIAAIKQRIAEADFEDGVYLLTDASFVPVAGNLKAWPSGVNSTDGRGDLTAREWKTNGPSSSLVRAQIETLPDGYHLLVGRNIADLDRFAKEINTALALGILFIFVLAGVASISVTRRTVGRIEAINVTSRAIMQSDLGQRIALRGTRDEWDQLAANLNVMLDRIETLMAEVKQVTDNVAHDLRTPLARMHRRLERACEKKRDADDDQLLINETIADLDGVLRMFTSLLRVSQIETSDRTVAFHNVNLTKIANEVVELFDAAAEEKGVHLSSVGNAPVVIAGDRDLLFDAVANLVDNAIKHGREDGHVTVDVAHKNGAATIFVADDGPGIPIEEREHVLKRFYRLERSRSSIGNGLGLSLVAAVARLHEARIEMMDNAPGLQFELHFPSPAKFYKENHLPASANRGRHATISS